MKTRHISSPNETYYTFDAFHTYSGSSGHYSSGKKQIRGVKKYCFVFVPQI
jgi:hypothetical protein